MAKEKQDFDRLIAVMAHDIKAPLSSIISLLDTILKGYLDNDLYKSKELVGRAHRKSKVLVKMLDDILDYSMISTRTNLKMGEVNIFEILKESVHMMKPYADEIGIRVTFKAERKISDKVWGNTTFLLRVFNNLIMNGIKYNKPKGKITIVYKKSRQLNEVEIKISDTGIGMDDEDVKKMFNLLERGKNAKKNIDGSIGLGMSLVKEIVNSHRGTIDVQSQLNVGTTIRVLLPLYDGATPKSDAHFCNI